MELGPTALHLFLEIVQDWAGKQRIPEKKQWCVTAGPIRIDPQALLQNVARLRVSVQIDQTVTQAKGSQDELFLNLDLCLLFAGREFGKLGGKPSVQFAIVFFGGQKVAHHKGALRPMQ